MLLILQGLEPPALACLFGILGLAFGSFFNVVIYRFPLMLQAAWQAECAQFLAEQQAAQVPPHAQDGASVPTPDEEGAPRPKTAFAPVGLMGEVVENTPKITLSHPASHCPQCQRRIGWLENIPVLSWLALRGRCRGCGGTIGWRYPAVELATAAWFGWCAWQWGATAQALAWCGFGSILLIAALIDWDTTFLPDEFTLPLLWAGLLGAVLGILPVDLKDAIYGAAIGYLSLWSIYWLFKLITGREGMGYGDFKLLAALGAWLGWQGLLPIILMSSIIGAIIGIILKFKKNLREGGYMPFGPFLAAAGAVVLVVGAENTMQIIHNMLGM